MAEVKENESVFDKFEASLDPDNQLEFQVFREYLRSTSRDFDNNPKCGRDRNPLRKMSQSQLVTTWRLFRAAGVNIDGEQVIIDWRGAPSLTVFGCKNMVFSVYPGARIEVQTVFKGDIFTYTRTEDGVKYVYTCNDPFADRSENGMVGVFCHIVTNDGTGTEVFEVMGVGEVKEIRKSSKTGDAWKNYFGEMAKKTCIKRATKSLRYDSRVSSVLDLDNEFNGNDFDNPDNPKQITEDDVVQLLNSVEIKDEESC